MTKIKLCGLSRICDIETANECMPDYIGFVFAPKSRRFVAPEHAAVLRERLNPGISAVGVFVNEPTERIAALLKSGVIDIAQLHGSEGEEDIRRLREQTNKPVFKGFRVDGAEDILRASHSSADAVLMDSGAGGTGTAFDWKLLTKMERPYILAGGLDPGNVREAVRLLHPYGVDVSSGIETDGWKDPIKMRAFVCAVRGKEEQK